MAATRKVSSWCANSGDAVFASNFHTHTHTPIRRAAAHDVAARVAYKTGCSLRQAIKEVVWESFSEGDGGFVGVGADYEVVWEFNRFVACGVLIEGKGLLSTCWRLSVGQILRQHRTAPATA